MTAYGYGEKAAVSQQGEGLTYACEIRTLNSRFLEVNVRLPRHLMALEVDIINHVKARLQRGKVDVFLDTTRTGSTRELPALDAEAVRHYFGLHVQLVSLARASGVEPPQAPGLAELTRLDGALTEGPRQARGQEAAEAHRTGLFAALDKALDATVATRLKEGDALCKALRELALTLDQGRQEVAALRDTVLPHLHRNVLKRLENLQALLEKNGQTRSGLPSDERLASEVTLLSDKVDIDEEITRLGTHVQEFLRLMETEATAGRKLDFLCQEMHREVNTMSNKLVQTDVAQRTLEMKQIIERIRQQVQNIE